MSTRSSARNLFPPLDNPELTIRRRSRVDPTLLNDFEMAGEGNDDALRLYLFPHSLTHHATAWFDRLPRNSINAFEQMAKMFLGKYFPPSMVTKLRNEITNFRQRSDESLFEAWEHYKLSSNQCPNHNMFLVTQIDTFYNDLTLRHRDTINAAAAQRSESSSSITSSSDTEITALKAEMAEINKNLMRPPLAKLRTYMMWEPIKFMMMNTASSLGSGTLPGNIITNPKDDLKGITTRSRTAYQGPTIPTTSSYLPPVVERETETTKDTMHPTNNGSTKDVQPPVVQTETPTLNSEPVVAPIIEPVVAPFFSNLAEEVDAFLALEDDPTSPEADQSYFDPEADIILLEAFINDDPSLPPPNQRNYLPQVRKELKICEAKTDKSSIDEPPEVELKDLPPLLEYAFLEGNDKFPVIIEKDLSAEEKIALITVLKSHKRAIAWKIFDIKGIDPEFCTHKILMEDDFEPAVQHQRRVNPKIHNVIKNEVLKLLDAGLIYPISDSPWVSPVHCVPKKGGFTVVENEENELILTRLVTRWRVCIYYQKLNEATRKDHFPLPFMDQILERLTGNKYYCFLDGFSGAVLGQRQEKHFRPIHYVSKTMTEAESNYTATEKEMLAVVYAFEKFWSYLIMNKSIVYTDHSALKYLFAKKDSKAILLHLEPPAIISDRGTHFCNDQFAKVMLKYGVTRRLATAYHPQTSGQVEVSNRGLKRILERTVGENHASWSDKLDDALWAFRTAYKTPIECTPYKLVYGKACHLPIELEYKSYWALKHANFNLQTAGDHRKIQLNELNELRDQAYENSLIYKEKTKRLHDSKIKDHVFNIGDRVLLFNSRLKIFSGNLKTPWSGPFTITHVFPYGTVELSQTDGPNFKIKLSDPKQALRGRSMGEDYRLVSEINRVFAEVNNVTMQRERFLKELDSLGMRRVPAKMAEFLRGIQRKDKETVSKSQVLIGEMELNASKKNVFIEKLQGTDMADHFLPVTSCDVRVVASLTVEEGDGNAICQSGTAAVGVAAKFMIVRCFGSSCLMDSSVSSRGCLNLECAMRPFGRSNEAIPDDATANTIFPCERKALITIFYMNVFSVPPRP
uniref:Reverse transcriptase domain-containing protein n=1 Tax=Tanacetum cinerariifolium TaxID=118510 RepID=A0A6L2P332_TANCI|nr:reverse transcriptase domain-containing protein [Tanacetum cinerariifolium]